MNCSQESCVDDVASDNRSIARGHRQTARTRRWPCQQSEAAVEEGRECDDILTQIAAVRAALDQVGKAILEQHITHCVNQAVKHGEADEAIRDLKDALDRFV